MPDNDLPGSLAKWSENPDSGSFPLAAVIARFRSVGKHFVDGDLLDALAAVRARLPADHEPLRRFLDTALDKRDGRFDNPSYLALRDLPLPAVDGGCPVDARPAERQRDRLMALLVADLLRFELAALDGATPFLPLMRPDSRTVAKRCALGLRVLRPALARLGLDVETGNADAVAVVRTLCGALEATQTGDERRMLAVTLLPVYTAHDEYLFIRMLQCWEVTFALVATHLRVAVVSVRSGDAMRAAAALRAAAKAMDEASPLFSLVATMQPEAFMAFREFTDGASAIQSRSYKAVESLCRRPEPERLAGPGYDAVPEVRTRIVLGQPTLAEAVADAALTSGERAALDAAMRSFEREVLGWRRTHHSLAVRMLGMKRGTGYTDGVPYLAENKDTPLFRCPFAQAEARAA